MTKKTLFLSFCVKSPTHHILNHFGLFELTSFGFCQYFFHSCLEIIWLKIILYHATCFVRFDVQTSLNYFNHVPFSFYIHDLNEITLIVTTFEEN